MGSNNGSRNHKDRLVAAIVDEGCYGEDAKFLAKAIRETVKRQSCSLGCDGKPRRISWPTRCFALASEIIRLREGNGNVGISE